MVTLLGPVHELHRLRRSWVERTRAVSDKGKFDRRRMTFLDVLRFSRKRPTPSFTVKGDPSYLHGSFDSEGPRQKSVVPVLNLLFIGSREWEPTLLRKMCDRGPQEVVLVRR